MEARAYNVNAHNGYGITLGHGRDRKKTSNEAVPELLKRLRKGLLADYGWKI